MWKRKRTTQRKKSDIALSALYTVAASNIFTLRKIDEIHYSFNGSQHGKVDAWVTVVKASWPLCFSSSNVLWELYPCLHAVPHDTLTRLISVVSGFLLNHHMSWREPLRGHCAHVGWSLVQRVQEFLLKALLEVGHTGVWVLSVVPAVSPTACTSSRGRGHTLQSLTRRYERGTHLSWACWEPGAKKSKPSLAILSHIWSNSNWIITINISSHYYKKF